MLLKGFGTTITLDMIPQHAQRNGYRDGHQDQLIKQERPEGFLFVTQDSQTPARLIAAASCT